MSKPITSDDLPPHLARFADAQIAAGRFASVEDVIEAGFEALRQRVDDVVRDAMTERKLAVLRAALDEGIEELDAGLGVETTPVELMTEISAELGLDS